MLAVVAGQSGLADSARSGHRHEPVLAKQPVQLPRIVGPAHETGQGRHKPMRATGRRSHGILPHKPNHTPVIGQAPLSGDDDRVAFRSMTLGGVCFQRPCP
jgi:hypothetical protein